MHLGNIAVSNLKVRKIKVLFLILGIVLGITTVVTLTSITLAMQEQLEDNLNAVGQLAIITPASDSLSLSYNGVSVVSTTSYQSRTISEKIVEKLEDIAGQGVSVIAPKLVQPVEIDSQKMLVAGVNFDSELRLKPYWLVKGNLPDAKQVVLGLLAAERLGLAAGDTVDINGSRFVVSGILAETGTVEDKLIYMALPEAQRLFKKAGEVTFIEVSIMPPGKEDAYREQAVIKQLEDEFPGVNVVPVKDQKQARRDIVDRFAKFSVLVSVVVLVIGGLIVLTTMMSSVKERTREIGIFRAIGFRQSHIIKVFLTEALIISIVGGVIGYFSGILLAKFASPFIAQLDVQIGWNPGLGLAAVLTSSFIGLIASAYPAYLAARLDPVEAFRSL